MEKENLESLLIDYIDGNLNEADRLMIEKELTENKEADVLYVQLKEVMNLMNQVPQVEPSASMKPKFEKSLKEEISFSTRQKQVFFQPWMRVAAAVALVMVGVIIGNKINQSRQHEEEIAALKKEMESQKNLMMAMLENQSASQRLTGATVAYDMKQADDDIVNALVKSMNEDTNTNVRLAALEALGKFYQQPHVRSQLVLSLATQKDPMVQIALIRLLVKMKEKQVLNELEKITRDNNVMKAVKDEAHFGILKLS
ncbi:MAG: HEAT repeat domain-containing protein [Bacteroidetes bacterium]|nr:HEAT repeat domain-containing protein [Bacteroidota bacterium]